MAPTDLHNGLSQERLKSLLHYEPGTGVFTWRAPKSRRVKAGSIAGTVSKATGYRKIKVDGRDYTASRLAWLYVTGEWPTHLIDHEDLNKSNDVWSNLRPATHAQNIQNRSVQGTKPLGLKGVFLKKDAYRSRPYNAAIRVGGRLKSLGYFSTPEEAHVAYTKASEAAFGEFARS